MIATTLSRTLDIPLIPIDHLEAHLFSVGLTSSLKFPSLVLLITGKNTALYKLTNEELVTQLESCADCALGEAFDKVARIMGLPYPGGHLLETYYRDNLEVLPLTKGNRDLNRLSLNFSGLITAASRIWELLMTDSLLDLERKREILSTSFHNEILEILRLKLRYWFKKLNLSYLYIVGGASKNLIIQNKLTKMLLDEGISTFYVDKRYAEDNGAMIAYRSSLLISR
ncbi:UGMP family protein [Candidatus Mycoplasma haematolamae str. Purdue]|uniref:N(6)-L-threonylcarbamoyladenine synthase n=1 Tax=Mycoplasma haematolamae (strain Purdue) TaxID=1212765 RepID=I7C554_MYCHA|nr:UGMP family protein [Candidatus Mycoplasma haematolamae str. Purdue]